MLGYSIISFPVPNRDISFRLRTSRSNRFKIATVLPENIAIELKERGIDPDDCDGEDFATIIRITIVDIQEKLMEPFPTHTGNPIGTPDNVM